MPSTLSRRPAPFTWRGLDFRLAEYSRHSGQCRFEALDSRWVVRRFSGGSCWYARVKLAYHRFSGSGSSKIRALDAALDAATIAQSELQEALAPLLMPAASR